MQLENENLDRTRRRIRVTLVLGALAALLVAGLGIASRRGQAAELRERADAQAVPTVAVISPGAAAARATLALPARTEAWSQAPIYARVGGYLKRWTVDIGGAVKAGQLLAEIETPELDQQLLQAQAELANARAAEALAATTAQRWQALVGSDSVSRQENEEKAGDLAGKQAAVKAAQANVERLQAMKRFTRIVAPFDGTVTARSTDVGALIDVGAAPATPLFVVADTRRLRVYASVPQSSVGAIHTGGPARLTVPERPGKTYAATVQSRSRAIDPASGSMLVQLAVDNTQGELLAGGFANLEFDLPRGAGVLTIPPGALIFDRTGLHVATVGAGDRAVLKTVTVARDLGAKIEIATGLAPDDRVIESPPDGIANGDPVRIAAPAAEGKPGARP